MKLKLVKEIPIIRELFIENSTTDKIICHNFEKRIILYLKLAAEGGRNRKVGVITKSTKTMLIRRKRALHLFKKASAYGFNEYVLREAKQFNMIWLKDEYDEWKIPVDYILKNGQYLMFKQQGFELQKFVTLLEIEPFRVKTEERRRF